MKDHHKKIEQYFAGELSDQEQQKLKQQLDADPGMMQAFELEKDLMAGIEAAGNDQLRAQLGQIHQEEIINRQGAKVHHLRRQSLWLVAAVLVVGLMGMAWWLLQPQTATTTQLYAQYADYSFDFVEKGGNKDALVQAETYLDKEEYAKALPLLEAYMKEEPEATNVILATGVAKLESGQDPGGAVTLFQQVSRKGGLFQNEANWHIGLAYLKQGQLEKSQDALAQIPASSVRFEKAQALIKGISMLSE